MVRDGDRLTLAAFGIVAAVTQGALSGPLVARFGEHRVAFWGLVFAAVAAAGYGFAWSLPVVSGAAGDPRPRGLVHPVMVALLSRAVPEDQQGQLQGISSVTNIAMLLGTLFYSQLFGLIMVEGAPPARAGWPFYVAGGLLLWCWACLRPLTGGGRGCGGVGRRLTSGRPAPTVAVKGDMRMDEAGVIAETETAGTERFTGVFTQQEPIPDEAIAAAVEVLRHGRLHRYNTAAGEIAETALWRRSSRR